MLQICRATIIRHWYTTYLSICTHKIGLFRIVRQCYATKINRLLMEVYNTRSIRIASNSPSTHHTICTTACQYSIIPWPSYTTYATGVALKNKVRWTIHSIKTIHVNQLILCSTIHCSKILSSITELNLLTCLEWYNLTVMLNIIIMVTDIHQS